MSPIEPPIAGLPATRQDLRRALQTMAAQAQAVGVLMAEHAISSGAARQRLSRWARRTGVTADALAAQLLAPYAVRTDRSDGEAQTG